MTEGNYSNVGHRGPIYKGLGAMNPCDNQSIMLVINLSCLLITFSEPVKPTTKARVHIMMLEI
jgi:hypothetical protein